MEIRKIIFILSQENSQSVCSECTSRLEMNVGCAVFLPSKSLYCLNCYLNVKKKIKSVDFSKVSIICSSDFYKANHCFLEVFGVWKPEEELALLEAVEKYGFGNWEDVTFVSSKPAEVYEEHYLKFYVDNPFIFELDEYAKIKSPADKSNLPSKFSSQNSESTPCCVRSKNILKQEDNQVKTEIKEEPLDLDHKHNSHSSKCRQKEICHLDSLSKKAHDNCSCPEELKLNFSRSQAKLTPLAASTGYNSGRDEFNIDPFNNEEFKLSIINDLSDCIVPDLKISKLCSLNDSNLLINCLSFALIENYNHCLKRREKMKKFVKEYNLLYNQNAFSWLKQYQAILNKETINNLSKLLQFIAKSEAKALLDGLKLVEDLKARLQDLKYYRIKGLQTFKEVEVFKELKQERKRKFMKSLDNMGPVHNDHNFVQLSMKRYSVPLDIEILPGYDKLLDDEKELCASARIIPSSYEHFKNLLVSECHKTNGLRLAQARKLAKICVNRTRRIYDFLLDKGLIWLPPS